MRYWAIFVIFFCFISLFFIPPIASTDAPDIYETDDTMAQAVEIIPDDKTAVQSHNFHKTGDEDWLKMNVTAGTTYIISTTSTSLNQNFKPVIELYDTDGINLSSDKENNSLTWFYEKNALFYVRIRHSDPNIYGDETEYQVWVEHCPPDEYDDDDNEVEWASVVVLGDAAQEHNFYAPGDVDWVKFYGVAGEDYTIEANVLGENANVVLELYSPDGITLLEVQDNEVDSSADETLSWYCAEDNVYYIRIINSDTDTYGKGMEYELSIERSIAAPAISGSVEGKVSDFYSGTPIKGAKIKTGAGNSALSSESGEYLIVLHPPGNFSITAEVQDYEFFEDTIAVPEWESAVKDIKMIPKTGKVSAPLFFPNPGTYSSSQKIEISCNTSGAVIRYTLDGSEPNESSQIYLVPIVISESTCIKARAYKSGWEPCDIAAGDYIITGTVSLPLFSPEPGIYPAPQDVKLSCSTAGSVIRYTTDGSEPNENSAIYTKPLSVSSGMTIKAKGFKKDWISSTTSTGVYTITGTVSMPLFLPEPGIYTTPQNIELSCATADAVIRYTVDGSEPDENSDIYTISISVSSGMMIKAKGFKKDWIASATATGIYTITGTVAVPLFSPEPGIYTTPQNVELSCDTADAVIRYTADGSEPDENSAIYITPISVSSGITLKAKGFKENWISSGTSTGIYTITGTVAPPKFSPAPGTYTTVQYVELFTATSGASIHYTTDGSEPDEYSALYTEPILVSSTTAVKAKAFKTDWAASSISTGIYTIIQTVEKPAFSPLPGLYTEPQQIELSCLTSDAVIRYTTDGSEPAEDSPVYINPLHLSETAVIKAKAFKNGWIASDTATGEYTITGTVENPAFSLPADIYISPQHVRISCPTPDAYIRYTVDGNEPTEDSPLCESEIIVKETLTVKAKSFKNMWKPSRTVTQHYIITETENSNSGGCFVNTLLN